MNVAVCAVLFCNFYFSADAT